MYLKVAVLLVVILGAGCVEARSESSSRYQSSEVDVGSPSTSSKLCEAFISRPSTRKLDYVEDFHGCPIYTDNLAFDVEAVKGIDSSKLAHLRQLSEERARHEVNIAVAVERLGFLERPDVQRSVLRFVGNLYLKENRELVSVSDEEVRVAFRDRYDEFQIPEYRLGRHVLYGVESDAPEEDVELAYTKIDSLRRELVGEGASLDSGSFAEVAAGNSQDSETSWQGGLLAGTGLKGEHLKIDPALARALFDLSGPGQISPPIRTEHGWHIIQFVRAVEGKERELEDVDEIVRNDLEKAKLEEVVSKVMAKAGMADADRGQK